MNTFATRCIVTSPAAPPRSLITAVLGMSFVSSTAVPRARMLRAVRTVGVQPEHAWFGQPEPAVLVD